MHIGIWVGVWSEELRSATNRSHGPRSGQHQAVLVTFLGFRKLTESCTERMCNWTDMQLVYAWCRQNFGAATSSPNSGINIDSYRGYVSLYMYKLGQYEERLLRDELRLALRGRSSYTCTFPLEVLVCTVTARH